MDSERVLDNVQGARKFTGRSKTILTLILVVAVIGAIPLGIGTAQECGLRAGGVLDSGPSWECETNGAMAFGVVVGMWAALAWSAVVAFAVLHIVNLTADQSEASRRTRGSQDDR